MFHAIAEGRIDGFYRGNAHFAAGSYQVTVTLYPATPATRALIVMRIDSPRTPYRKGASYLGGTQEADMNSELVALLTLMLMRSAAGPNVDLVRTLQVLPDSSRLSQREAIQRLQSVVRPMHFTSSLRDRTLVIEMREMRSEETAVLHERVKSINKVLSRMATTRPKASLVLVRGRGESLLVPQEEFEHWISLISCSQVPQGIGAPTETDSPDVVAVYYLNTPRLDIPSQPKNSRS
jgi:hypothetical protein